MLLHLDRVGQQTVITTIRTTITVFMGDILVAWIKWRKPSMPIVVIILVGLYFWMTEQTKYKAGSNAPEKNSCFFVLRTAVCAARNRLRRKSHGYNGRTGKNRTCHNGDPVGNPAGGGREFNNSFCGGIFRTICCAEKTNKRGAFVCLLADHARRNL